VDTTIRQHFEPTDPDSIANAFAAHRRRTYFDRALLTLGLFLAATAVLLALLYAVLALFAPAIAHAGTGDEATQADAAGWLRVAYDAVTHGGPGAWKLVAGAALSLIVYALRTYSATPVPLLNFKIPLPAWFRTRRGGAVLVLALAFLGGLGHGLLAMSPGDALSLRMLESAAMVALAAIGGYEGLRALFSGSPPPLKPVPLR